MKQLMYYEMRAYFYPREITNSVEFKLSELETLWFCSLKNVKRKLKQLAEEEKIVYSPGLGRGNSSTITFKQPFQTEIEEEAKKLIRKDQIEDIIQLLQLPIPKTWIANISREVQELFGLQTSTDSGDILRTIISRKITTLDPLHTSMNFESYLLQQLGDTLVTYDDNEDSIHPHLAHHWESSDDHKNWIFHLRKGVRFHNQSYLTSEDVKHTFQRFQQNSSSFQWLIEDIIEITCLSLYKIEFTLKRSNPFFLRYISSPNLAILPKDEPFDERIWIGSGPFQMKQNTDTKIVLRAFDHYFLTRPLLDEVEIYSVKHETSKYLTSFEIGKDGESKNPINKESFEVGFRFLAFNFKKETIVHNPFIREAIFHLFDVNRMAVDVGRTNLKESSSYFYWKASPQHKDRKLVPYLLNKAHYQGEVLTIFTVGYPSYIEEAEWLKREAEEFGLQFEIKTYQLSELYGKRIEEADLLFMGDVASTDYHLSFIGAFLNKSLIFNRFFSDGQLEYINSIFEEIKNEDDKNIRDRLIDKVESYIKRENLYLYLYHPIKKRSFHPLIKDVKFTSFGFVDLQKIWIKH
ncbi:ABC transporter substrate-binding protein [Fredinandcohnia sp. 179-A 10B2 NHS]|uniref:ABC transporter substrate-binding protein n=1 Tax=Fredinandcohnia sp. 179-A 10B2 NHS TaxID=3235176 RepID=UPI0039A20400